jgi:hypothetical protein
MKREKLRRLAYKTTALARAVDISRSIIYEEIRDGRLLARKCHGRTIILRTDAIRWLEGLPVLRANATAKETTAGATEAQVSGEIAPIPGEDGR